MADQRYEGTFVLCVSHSELSISVVLVGELIVGDLKLIKQVVI